MPAYFINADLDVFSSSSLSELAEEIGRKAFVLYDGIYGDEGKWLARFELSDSEQDPEAANYGPKSPEQCIGEFCDIIGSLSPKGRSIWNSAQERIIDLGYERSAEEHCVQGGGISRATLRRMAEFNISLAWTFYKPGSYTSEPDGGT